MKNKLIICFLLQCMLLLTGCSSSLNVKNEAWLTKKNAISLPDIDLPDSYEDQQLLTVFYNNETNSLITLIDFNKNSHELTVIGLSPLGVKLFEIKYDGNEIEVEQNIFIKELPNPSQILSDIMLTLSSSDSWNKVLPKGWIITDNHTEKCLKDYKGDSIIEIKYNIESSGIRKPSSIKHNVFNYEIQINSME